MSKFYNRDAPSDCHIYDAYIGPPGTTPGLIGRPDWQSQTGRVWVIMGQNNSY